MEFYRQHAIHGGNRLQWTVVHFQQRFAACVRAAVIAGQFPQHGMHRIRRFRTGRRQP
ncbi:hypothetical protein D3C80_2001810 [compost metagenome]